MSSDALKARADAILKQLRALAIECDALADDLGREKYPFEAGRVRIAANCQRDQISRLRDVAHTLSK